MSVKWLTTLGFAATLALAAVIVAVSQAALRAVVASTDAVTYDYTQDLLEAARFRYIAEQAVADSRGFLLTSDPQTLARMTLAEQDFEETVARFRVDLEEAEAGRFLVPIERAERAHNAALRQLVERRRQGTPAQEVAGVYEREVKPRRIELDAALEAFEAHKRQQLGEAMQRSSSASARATRLIPVIAGVGLLLSLALAIVITRTVVRLHQRAEEAIRARDEFLAVASHELRNPLNALQLHLQVLRQRLGGSRSDGASADQDPLAPIERQVARLVVRIDRLLDVSRLASRSIDVELDDVELTDLVREVVARSGEQLNRSACALQMRADDTIVGRWDRMRLEQVVTNLLENAMKYGAGKPIEVSVARHGDAARLAVRDHGIGIPPEQQERIFARFERVAPKGQYAGLGLGLWITREIVTGLGGTIRVASRPGEGSTFTVDLPVRPAMAHSAAS